VIQSAFDDENEPPVPRTLAKALGGAFKPWSRLIAGLQDAHGPLAEQWHFAGRKFGWSLRLREDKRVLVYLLPGRGSFRASFALGSKACKAAHEVGLPAPLLALIDAAPQYAEGRGVRITVRTMRDVAGVVQLAACKAGH
jgi:hypothetical protein